MAGQNQYLMVKTSSPLDVIEDASNSYTALLPKTGMASATGKE
jgi:hypothetical protein